MSAAMSATSITTTSGTAVGAPRSRAVAAEWSKLGGSRGTCLAYILLGVLTVILSGMVAAGTSTEPAGSFGDDDLIVNSLGGLLVGIVVAVVIGAITLGGEYSSGMITALVFARVQAAVLRWCAGRGRARRPGRRPRPGHRRRARPRTPRSHRRRPGPLGRVPPHRRE